MPYKTAMSTIASIMCAGSGTNPKTPAPGSISCKATIMLSEPGHVKRGCFFGVVVQCQRGTDVLLFWAMNGIGESFLQYRKRQWQAPALYHQKRVVNWHRTVQHIFRPSFGNNKLNSFG